MILLSDEVVLCWMDVEDDEGLVWRGVYHGCRPMAISDRGGSNKVSALNHMVL